MSNATSIAARLMGQPAAPFFEERVREDILRICTEHDLGVRTDPLGNIFVELATAPRRRPLVLAAHMDHPGFEVVRRLSPRRFVLQFNGGVPDEYFKHGVPALLQPGDVRARLARRVRGRSKRFEFLAEEIPASAPRFAVWDLEAFARRGGRLVGRACDDLVGCAAVLATMIELRRRRAKVHVIGVLSRAEEVGFHGALTIAAARRIPPNALVISLETSKEVPPVRMGDGVIVRVGDRSSTFDADATRYLTELATELAGRDRRFRFQRALMGGGTCEATAYQEHGYTVAAVCVALGNYHNCGPRARIAEEYVNARDVSAMVELLIRAARAMPRYATLVGRLPKRLDRLLTDAKRTLRRARRP